ncbi:DUF721 domain-containing protein [Kingella kingae]|uniref:DUF721 domain-containing protein n=2 Tax=Kingella kingae TaxID=504 RepID=F5SA18_KINKI|nr:DUF721 domain-containing protein [Kingella kingae]EGK06842.1 hypothetical protein HMPREF0476_2051 [Kingella kingae ATCC 23330]EIC13036.1 hypothetical protein KKB_08204 [Kingella kingae PYKK081]MBD3613631.1 DUF721 domain-containing protein [Kingella kingae]MBD3632207.1 DUF721 domain-containing protein [Kingella kingae]MBD3659701.1 DUF721 domain-containing protein [Kingella kingae]
MELDKLLAPDGNLTGLLRQAQYFNQLDQLVKRLLPPNLREHCRVVCVEESDLVIHAYIPMAASRLKMMLPALLPQIQQHCDWVRHIRVYTQPRNPSPERNKTHSIPSDALPSFERTAQKVEQYPELAQALRDLIQHQQ